MDNFVKRYRRTRPASCLILLLAAGYLWNPVQCHGQTGNRKSSDQAKFERFGHTRGRAPKEWTKFDWPQKREVLFEHYAPTDQELKLIVKAAPAKPLVPAKQSRRLLVFYRCQYPHASIATGNAAIEQLAKTGAFEIELTDDPKKVTKENLARFDALLLNNTTDWDKTIGASGQAAVVGFVKGGKGLIGIHAASDSCKGWREGAEMIGGVFKCHPWLPKGTWAFQLESPNHPLNRAFKGKGFWLRDEIYAYRAGTHSRDRSRVLVGLDLNHPHNHDSKDLRENLKPLTRSEPTRPVAWIDKFGDGRVFYSNFGHNNTTYWNPIILQHYLDGIQFALGDIEAETMPSGELLTTELRSAPSSK